MDEKDEQELAGLLILENRLIEKREEILSQLKPVQIRVNQLIRAKNSTGPALTEKMGMD